MKTLPGFVSLLLASLLLVACGAPPPEIDRYMTEMAGLANKLVAVDAAAEQGDWQGAGQSLEEVRISLATVAEGIDRLENEGVTLKQVTSLRAAYDYLDKAAEVSGVMITWYRRVAELKPETLTESSDTSAATESLNELITLASDARAVLWDFLEYGQQFYASDTEGAEKLKVQITVPRKEHLYNSLDERITEYQGYLDSLQP